MATNASAAAALDGRPTDSRSGVIVGVVAALLPLTTLIVGLRFYTRTYLRHAIGVDDWMTLVSLILAIADGVIMCVMTTKGLGRHIWTLSDAELSEYMMVFYLSIVFYYAGLGTVKLAILTQYMRVFAVKMRKVTIAAMVVIGMWSAALVLTAIFACHPVEGFWDKDVPATCIPNLPQWYINAAGNITTDIVIFALPIPVLWKLHLPRSQRLSLIGIFGLGFFTCTISVIRISFLNLTDDDTYVNVGAAGWSIGELCSGIICACLPTLRPASLFRLLPAPLRPRYHHSYQHHQDGSPGGGGGGNKNSTSHRGGTSGRTGAGATLQTFGGGVIEGHHTHHLGGKLGGVSTTTTSKSVSSVTGGRVVGVHVHGRGSDPLDSSCSSTEELTRADTPPSAGGGVGMAVTTASSNSAATLASINQGRDSSRPEDVNAIELSDISSPTSPLSPRSGSGSTNEKAYLPTRPLPTAMATRSHAHARSTTQTSVTGSSPTPTNTTFLDPVSAQVQAAREELLGLRQGTMTSIEARPASTQMAASWAALGGRGIQIRREVAQDVEELA